MTSYKAVALIYSPYHERLLLNNRSEFSSLEILYVSSYFRVPDRPDGIERHRLGTELSTIRLGGVRFASRYYRKISTLIDRSEAEKVIIFTTEKPLSRYLIDRYGAERIALWEDGLSHYLPVGTDFRYKALALVKALLGFYRGRIFDRRYGRDKVEVRDRFVEQNLRFDLVSKAGPHKLFIGQPVVEDGIVAKRAYFDVVKLAIDRGFKYLPHPRERIIQQSGQPIVNTGLSAEDYIALNGCSVCMSVFSTVNLNVSTQKNIFLARLFGLHDVDKALTLIGNVTDITIPSSIPELEAEL